MFNGKELCMKLIKSLVLIVLLVTGSDVFAGNAIDDFMKTYKKWILHRENLRKNGTPSQKADIENTDIVFNIMSTANSIGLCSFVVDTVLASTEATRDIDNRGTVATASCSSLYAALYASLKYEEIQKSKEKKASSSSWF
jgi:hypothetical protein